MIKKIGRYLLTAVLAFSSMFAVVGCGKDDDNDNNDSNGSEDVVEITKKDYIEAFDSVTTTYNAYLSETQTSGLSAEISADDFVDANNDYAAKNMGMASVAMIYFIKGIFNREEYIIKDGADDCFVNDVNGDIYDIRFKTKYESKKSLITVDIVADYRDSISLQYFVFGINYDFDSDKLNNFTILGFSGTDNSKTTSNVRYYKFENNNLKGLSHEAESFIPFAEGVLDVMETLITPVKESNPEDYSAEYIAAMQAAFN